MDELSQSLKRRALAGDLDALQQYRLLSIKLGKIPREILLTLATLNYPPAREMFTEVEIAHFRGNHGTVRLLYSYDGFDAHCIVNKVIAAMMPSVLEEEITLRHALDVCISEEDKRNSIFLVNLDLMEVLHDADRRIRQLSDPTFLLDIIQRTNRARAATNEPWDRGWYAKDALVNQFYQCGQRLTSIDERISNCTEFEVRRGGPFFHLNLALRAMSTIISPSGLQGEHNLEYAIHQMRTYLFGMNFEWQNNAFVEAIFSYYLI